MLLFFSSIRNDPWPKEMWGIDLGQKLYKIRKFIRPIESTDIDRLKLLGVIFDEELEISTRSYNRTGYHKCFYTILDALVAFKICHGHLNVPRKFVVPENDYWPSHTHGLPLGIRVGSIRQGL